MACKFHEFKYSIIDSFKNELIKYSAPSGSMEYLYYYTYRHFYGSEKAQLNENFIRFCGINVDNLIAVCDNNINLIEEFIDRQFYTLVDMCNFECNCERPALKTKCEGDGTCITRCNHICICNLENCICHHKEHGQLCPTECYYNCKPVLCENFNLCGNYIPEWVNQINYGICFHDCNWGYGKIVYLDRIADCHICYENKNMIKLQCGHELCVNCWKNIVDSVDTINISPSCPFCRYTIWD